MRSQDKILMVGNVNRISLSLASSYGQLIYANEHNTETLKLGGKDVDMYV